MVRHFIPTSTILKYNNCILNLQFLKIANLLDYNCIFFMGWDHNSDQIWSFFFFDKRLDHMVIKSFNHNSQSCKIYQELRLNCFFELKHKSTSFQVLAIWEVYRAITEGTYKGLIRKENNFLFILLFTIIWF